MVASSLAGRTVPLTGFSGQASIGAVLVTDLAEVGADVLTTWWRP